jgi:SAM-dependent methyltransferase
VSSRADLYQDRRRAGSFGDDAEQYDRTRPSYPAEMIDNLLAEQPRLVLDVGCGTGIASRLFMDRGCQVLGVEPDARMAAVARRRGATVEEGAFEQWEDGGRRFDLLVAGQSWHWVDPHAGARKAAAVLRPGGRIGLFWNQAFPGEEARLALAPVYERLAPMLGERSVFIGQRDGQLYESIAAAARDTDLFDQIATEFYEHERAYTTAEWLELATTHSDHRTLPPADLARLLDTLREELDRIGGRVPVRYETTLVTGRTRSS